jgi:predicted phosphodiesterase
MISKDRAKEIGEYADSHGNDAAMTSFNLNEETYNRYMRIYRKEFKRDSTYSKLLDKYGKDGVVALLSDSGRTPIDVVYREYEGTTLKFLAMGDTHIGSKYFNSANLLSAFKEADKQGCTFLVHTGDLLEGMSGRPGHIYELTHIGYRAQRDEAIRLFNQWGKDWYVIEGNHDLWGNSKHGAGITAVEDVCDRVPNSHFIGYHEGDIVINDCKIKLWHGEDSGGSYAHSYRLQKLVEAFNGGEKPQVLFTGHTHKSMYLYDRNIHCISTGCLQNQSGFMRTKRLAAHVGFWIIEMVVDDSGEVLKFAPSWYPFYK